VLADRLSELTNVAVQVFLGELGQPGGSLGLSNCQHDRVVLRSAGSGSSVEFGRRPPHSRPFGGDQASQDPVRRLSLLGLRRGSTATGLVGRPCAISFVCTRYLPGDWFSFPLRENRGFVCLQKLRQSHWPLSADLLHQVVRSRKHSILVVFRNLLEMLPQRVGWRRPPCFP